MKYGTNWNNSHTHNILLYSFQRSSNVWIDLGSLIFNYLRYRSDFHMVLNTVCTSTYLISSNALIGKPFKFACREISLFVEIEIKLSAVCLDFRHLQHNKKLSCNWCTQCLWSFWHGVGLTDLSSTPGFNKALTKSPSRLSYLGNYSSLSTTCCLFDFVVNSIFPIAVSSLITLVALHTPT